MKQALHMTYDAKSAGTGTSICSVPVPSGTPLLCPSGARACWRSWIVEAMAMPAWIWLVPSGSLAGRRDGVFSRESGDCARCVR
jgi:hypothetical protein